MRLFIGLEFSEETKKTLLDIQNDCKPFIKNGNLYTKENFHLTVRYLGKVDDQDISAIKSAVEETAKQTDSFDLVIEGLDVFTKKNRFILWASPQRVDPLIELYNQVEESLLNYAQYRRESQNYTPHITLGRNIRFKKSIIIENVSEQLPQFPPISLSVHHLTLFESTRMNDALYYQPIYRSQLKRKTAD